ncbi:hypothetical protein [Streptomyces sp. NPDC002851]
MSREVRGVQALSIVLLVLACLLTPLGALSTWAKYQIGDSDRYVDAMAPLADDPDVQRAVADVVSDEILKQVDLGPLEVAVEGFVVDAVRSFAATDAFRTAWDAANRAAYDAVQEALDKGGTSNVTIDIAPITERVKGQLAEDGVPFADAIPVQHTEVTVMRAKDLGNLRKGSHMLQVAGLWLPLAALLCAAAGIALALRRRRALTATALGLALGAALLAIGLAIARRMTLSDLPPDVSKPAVAAVYDALTASLRVTAWTILLAGLAVAAAAWWNGRAKVEERLKAAGRSKAAGRPRNR